MSAEFDLDDTPFDADKDSNIVVDDDGKVSCPECQGRFKPSGLNRHITVTHGGTGAVSKPKKDANSGNKRGINIASTGAEFQRGVSLLVSMACSQCATALYQDAEKDWLAINEFCLSRPKLAKQVRDMLSVSDFMLLVGALGGTAQKMLSHHAIGNKLPMGMNGSEHTQHNTQQAMAEFMLAIPVDERTKLIEQALSMAANA